MGFVATSNCHRVRSRWGQVDFLFNNAGVVYIGDLLDMPHEAWKRTMDVNLWGVINGVRAAYPRMVRRGSGCIVNTASIAGLSPSPGFAIYSTSKHAVVGLSQALRGEAKKYGVQVNVLCPGVVSTPMVTNAHFSGIDGSGATAELRDRTPFAEPDRVAADLMNGVTRDKAVIVSPSSARFAMTVFRYFPFAGELFAAKFIERIRAYRATK